MTHHYTDKNPMSEARRNAIHGPLEVERRKEFISWIGLALVGLVTGIVLFLALVADLKDVA